MNIIKETAMKMKDYMLVARQVVITLITLLALIVFWEKTISKIGQFFSSPAGEHHLNSWWWLLLGIVVLAILIWFLASNAKARSWFGAVRISKWFLGVAVIILLVIGYQKMPDWFPNGLSGQQTVAAVAYNRPQMTPWRLSADVVLPIIARCESGGRQFDELGNLIKNPDSSAIGKYQILASLHEERAKSLGFDIRTLEGNEGYAYFLYGESGTKAWEADSRSLACWGPKLLAIDDFLPALEATVWTISATKTEWTLVHVPLGEQVVWERTTVVAYEIKTQTGEIYTFPRELGNEIRIKGRVTSMKFRVKEDESVENLSFRLRFKSI